MLPHIFMHRKFPCCIAPHLPEGGCSATVSVPRRFSDRLRGSRSLPRAIGGTVRDLYPDRTERAQGSAADVARPQGLVTVAPKKGGSDGLDAGDGKWARGFHREVLALSSRAVQMSFLSAMVREGVRRCTDRVQAPGAFSDSEWS